MDVAAAATATFPRAVVVVIETEDNGDRKRSDGEPKEALVRKGRLVREEGEARVASIYGRLEKQRNVTKSEIIYSWYSLSSDL